MKQESTSPSPARHVSGPLLAGLALLLLASMACRAVMGAPTPPGPGSQGLPTAAPETPAQSSATTGRPTAILTTAPADVTPSGAEPSDLPPAETSPTATPPGDLATRIPSGPTALPNTGTENTAAALTCVESPVTSSMLPRITAETWMDWVEKLSGAEPVTIGGEETIIETRYSPSMFDDQPNARAFEFVLEQVQSWYPQEQIEVMDYTVTRQNDGAQFVWQNLILTLPGDVRPEEIVILSAHLDSTSSENPEERAPGAEDNGSGSATLLEIARLLQGQRFERTIQIIWFTGEEQGLLGSRNFVEQLENKEAITGVLNLDMFGYDSDSDRCFEIHVGHLPQSDEVGQCFVNSIEAYELDIPRYDYLTVDAIAASDHGSFWNAEIGAIEILENMFDNGLSQGCTNDDQNPHYHSAQDTVDNLNPETAVLIARAALATVMDMAIPVP